MDEAQEGGSPHSHMSSPWATSDDSDEEPLDLAALPVQRPAASTLSEDNKAKMKEKGGSLGAHLLSSSWVTHIPCSKAITDDGNVKKYGIFHSIASLTMAGLLMAPLASVNEDLQFPSLLIRMALHALLNVQESCNIVLTEWAPPR